MTGMGEMESKIQVTGQIYLSPITPDDVPAMVEHLNERDIYTHTLRIPFPYTEENAESFLRIIIDLERKHGHPLHFAIRNESAQMIGAVGFEGIIYGHRAEIGYWLAKPFWGQGIMTQVVRTACEHVFGEWKLIRITAHVFDFNQGSARVLEKCGFVREGTLRKHHQKDGQFLDSFLYGLVR